MRACIIGRIRKLLDLGLSPCHDSFLPRQSMVVHRHEEHDWVAQKHLLTSLLRTLESGQLSGRRVLSCPSPCYGHMGLSDRCTGSFTT